MRQVIARKLQQIRKLPMYPERMVRLSGSPRVLTAMTMGKVSTRATSQTTAAARNLPTMADQMVVGKVPKSSIVPLRCSSDQSRIPSAGASNM